MYAATTPSAAILPCFFAALAIPFSLRISTALNISTDDHYKALAKSFMVSADNAHSVHPNHPELSDKTNYPVLNKGVVIKEGTPYK